MSKRLPDPQYGGKTLPSYPQAAPTAPRGPSTTPNPPVETDTNSPGMANVFEQTGQFSRATIATVSAEPESNPLPPAMYFPPPLGLPPTTQDLLLELKYDLQFQSPPPSTQKCGWYHVYYVHWELCQRGLITRADFDHGVTVIYRVLETQHLLDLHHSINSGPPTVLQEPWNVMDYINLMGALSVVFQGAGEESVEDILRMTEAVVGRMRAERARRGL